ncbi:MAG: OmpA family protein, partial [Saprospiraceae bacterium]
ISWQCYYCNNKLPKINKDNDWFFSTCYNDKYIPHSGNAMIKMVHEENCSNLENNGNLGNGCTSYITQKLITPLKIGDTYEISFWVLLVDDTFMEPLLKNHLGFTLSNKNIHMSRNSMLKLKYYGSMNITPGKWSKIIKYIRPQCELNYLTIGLFKDDIFPKLFRRDKEYDFYYYIDDVKVVKISEDSLNSTVNITPHCQILEMEQKNYTIPQFESFSIYFNSARDRMEEKYKNLMDSIFKQLPKKLNHTFKITGYTDNKGHENCELGMRRAEGVKQYLVNNEGISEFRLLTFSKCESNAIATNNTALGRSLNRRVEIKESEISLASCLYRSGLYFDNINQLERSKDYFIKWLKVAPKKEWICLLFDTRLKNLNQKNLRKIYHDQIRSKYIHLYSNAISFVLDSLYFEDQRYRTLSEYLYGITGFINDLDSFNFKLLKVADSSFLAHDKVNYINAMKFYLHDSLPKMVDVGYRSAMALCMIINHSRDTNLIKKYLPILYSNCIEGEGDFEWYAQLYDIYLLESGNLQHYGTQYKFIDNNRLEAKLDKHIPLYDLNLKRKSIGLSPILEN